MLKHMRTHNHPYELVSLCHDDAVSDALKAIAAKAKGPGRMYNIVSAINKVGHFFHAVHQLSAPSIFVTNCLLKQYNRLR